MGLDTFFAFLIASIVISVSPGAGAVNTLSNGVLYGVRGTLPAIAGLQIGLLATTLLVGIGLGAIIGSSVYLFNLIKWVGVAYLIYLGYCKWRDKGDLALSSNAKKQSARKQFSQAVLVNLTNPKAIVFLIALFPQFVDPQAPKLMQFFILGGTMVVVDTIVMLGYASLASRLSRWVQEPKMMRLQNRIFGSLFVGAGIALATSAKSSAS